MPSRVLTAVIGLIPDYPMISSFFKFSCIFRKIWIFFCAFATLFTQFLYFLELSFCTTEGLDRLAQLKFMIRPLLLLPVLFNALSVLEGKLFVCGNCMLWFWIPPTLCIEEFMWRLLFDGQLCLENYYC